MYTSLYGYQSGITFSHPLDRSGFWCSGTEESSGLLSVPGASVALDSFRDCPRTCWSFPRCRIPWSPVCSPGILIAQTEGHFVERDWLQYPLLTINRNMAPAPLWNKEECAYFLEKIVSKSKYSSGQFSVATNTLPSITLSTLQLATQHSMANRSSSV
jgi:hypothetical protein